MSDTLKVKTCWKESKQALSYVLKILDLPVADIWIHNSHLLFVFWTSKLKTEPITAYMLRGNCWSQYGIYACSGIIFQIMYAPIFLYHGFP